SLTVEPPWGIESPYTLLVSGGAPGQVVRLFRSYNGVSTEIQQSPIILDGSGNGVAYDHLYPAAEWLYYEMYSSTAEVYLFGAEGGFQPYPDYRTNKVHPWLKDTSYPEERNTSTTIMEIVDRSYRSRIKTFSVVGRAGYITSGDVRQLSTGTLKFLAYDRYERDQLKRTLETGGPVLLRIPVAQQQFIDDMVFTPGDLQERFFGAEGYLIEVDFTEVDDRVLQPVFQAVNYGEQKANALVGATSYDDLRGAFAGYTYTDLYRSTTGIAP
ncbi:MAG: hypothetical protein H0T54_09810, partial [Geodermatophilaceae bacterium]|nr:hypothetical protein [Geodermatophilaceae bacterium]